MTLGIKVQVKLPFNCDMVDGGGGHFGSNLRDVICECPLTQLCPLFRSWLFATGPLLSAACYWILLQGYFCYKVIH